MAREPAYTNGIRQSRESGGRAQHVAAQWVGAISRRTLPKFRRKGTVCPDWFMQSVQSLSGGSFMTTQSKSQEAAQLRVKQIRAEFRERISERTWEVEGSGVKRFSLNSLEKRLHKGLAQIAKLVKEHGLDQSIVTDFRNDILNDLFEEAGSRKDHAWQARFAKKYGL